MKDRHDTYRWWRHRKMLIWQRRLKRQIISVHVYAITDRLNQIHKRNLPEPEAWEEEALGVAVKLQEAVEEA